MVKFKYSVIIISYNEEDNIKKCITNIREANPFVQIILSDGGSTDATLSIGMKENVEIVYSSPGRGIQCNSGVKYAKGEIILFLHADTILPRNTFDILDKYFSLEEVKIGTFRLGFYPSSPIFSLYSKFTIIDSIFTRFGDQCITLRKNFLEQIGGFKNWPLYEDVDLLRRARKMTKIYSFPTFVITSARRFRKRGIILQQLLNGYYISLFLLGMSPFKLAKKYNSFRK